MTAKASAVAEVAVKFVKNPTATSGSKQLTIAGSTDVGGYVYCAVAKTNSRFRMLNATANTTAKNTTTANKTKTAVAITNLQDGAAAKTFNIQRATTKTGALTFSMNFAGLLEGKSYKWMCEATSLSPQNPRFRTAMVEGTQATNPAPKVEEKAASALWSSLFAAILMIAAVFFY